MRTTEVLPPQDITKTADNLLEHISEAQTKEEYKSALDQYEEFKIKHKDCGVCLPQAPVLKASSFPALLTPQQKACKKSYRIGWKHGKRWAQIIIRDGENKAVGEDHLKCLLGYLEPQNIDSKMVCAYKAARASYDKWYSRLINSKAKEQYRSFKKDDPSTLLDIEPPHRHQMTSSEAAFVRSLGLTPDMS